MANDKCNDPIMIELRKKHPKQGPDPRPGEPLDKWAERYIEYVHKKYNLKEPQDGAKGIIN